MNCVQYLPGWMTLMAPDDLKTWSKVILNDMECEERSCQAFVALARKGKRGYAEACRVLAHLIKDKDLDPEKPRSSSSQWLKRASEEAMDALEHPEIFENWTFNGPRTFFVYRSLASLECMSAFIKTIKLLGDACPC